MNTESQESYGQAKPYDQTFLLYFMHFFFSSISNMWDMGIVLLLSSLTNNDLSIVALCGLISSLTILLLMPLIGKYVLDTWNRLLVVQVSLVLKLISVSITYLLCIILLREHQSMQQCRYIYLIPVLYTITTISFTCINQCIEKDWIIVLSNNDSTWLASINSIMSQIDLICASLAPVITGALFGYYNAYDPVNGNIIVAVILLALNTLSSIGLYIFLYGLYITWPSLSHRSKLGYDSISSDEDQSAAPTQEKDIELVSVSITATSNEAISANENQSGFNGINMMIKNFQSSNCVGAMIAYAFLYCTVLSYGSLMTVYLRWAGVRDTWIGITRGLASVTGFLGAVIYPACTHRFGLYQSGQMAIIYQCLLVMLAAISFYVYNRHASVLIVMITVVSALPRSSSCLVLKAFCRIAALKIWLMVVRSGSASNSTRKYP
jgi:solute carrier family 40 (iron-regulated transporter), member 1